MATYCIRIIEYLDKDKETGVEKWVRCGKIEDNFHGFDQWVNEYYGRGLPDGHTVAHEEMYDPEDGRKWCWGESYIMLSELEAWVNREKEEAISMLYNDIVYDLIFKKIRDIDSYLRSKDKTYTEIASESIREDEKEDATIIENLDYFKENVEEIFDTYETLSTELATSYAFIQDAIEKKGEYYIEPERKRIVYYFC